MKCLKLSFLHSCYFKDWVHAHEMIPPLNTYHYYFNKTVRVQNTSVMLQSKEEKKRKCECSWCSWHFWGKKKEHSYHDFKVQWKYMPCLFTTKEFQNYIKKKSKTFCMSSSKKKKNHIMMQNNKNAYTQLLSVSIHQAMQH